MLGFIVTEFKKDTCDQTGVVFDVHAETVEKAVEQTTYDASQIHRTYLANEAGAFRVWTYFN